MRIYTKDQKEEMNGISLTASMRSNLLSLQNISGQVSSTQNKLATGNKVNSAIDNPSSYYTARSLNNRADDLNALLDSMGQAVSTIKAATTALESATEFLEQAKAVANQALETAQVPDKAFFEEKVGKNGAVVTTAQELRDAIAAGKETICVYGAIDLGDISQTGGLTLQENQKLVGVGYFGNYDADTNKFSSISAIAQNIDKDLIYINQSNVTVSDLSIHYNNTSLTNDSSTIRINGGGQDKQHYIILDNLDVSADFSGDNTNSRRAIYANNLADIKFAGKININVSGINTRGIEISNSKSDIDAELEIKTQNAVGIMINSSADFRVNSQAKIDIEVSGLYAYGIALSGNSNFQLNSGSVTNIKTSGDNGYGINLWGNAKLNIDAGSFINITTTGKNGIGIMISEGICNINTDSQVTINTLETGGAGIFIHTGGVANILGNLQICSFSSQGIYVSTGNSNQLNIFTSAKIYFNVNREAIAKYADATNVLNISQGAKLAFAQGNKIIWYRIKEQYINENDATSFSLTSNNIKDKLNVEEISAWKLPEKIKEDKEEASQDLGEDSKLYQEILNQYDSLIKDANYKGINLLQPEKLTVKFKI